MNPNEPPPRPDDALLRRYREANALDPARPDPALRERVLAHARQAAEERAQALPPARRPATAANDSVWAWRALGGLAVVGLVSLLVLQFDRGTPEEQEIALGSGVSRPSPPTRDEVAASAPAAADSASGLAADKAKEAALPSKPAPRQPLSKAPNREARGREPGKTTSIAQKADQPARIAPLERAPAADFASAPPVPSAPATAQAPAEAEVAPAPAPVPSAMAPPAAVANSSVGGVAREKREIVAAKPMPPLLAASTAGDIEAVKRLLAERADPNVRDAQGRTPLMSAARRGDEAMVRLLLAAGADRGRRDVQGLTAADHAERSGHADLLPLLR